jgi:hypothetical protein
MGHQECRPYAMEHRSLNDGAQLSGELAVHERPRDELAHLIGI